MDGDEEMSQYIIRTTVLSKFHEQMNSLPHCGHSVNKKNAPAPGVHIFPPFLNYQRYHWEKSSNQVSCQERTINLASRVTTAPPLDVSSRVLTRNKFHEDRTINVASRVLTIRKNAPPPLGHAFEPTGTIFENSQYIIAKYFHEDQAINMASMVKMKNAPPPLWRPFQDIIETNLLTKFHDDRTINVASRVLTRQMTPHDGRKAITKAHHENIVLRYM
ncbi:hypothetical protein DPMN_035836 [Dreissena polymorpha]|uniref:Uncharacterized protein n=1 Tax=Dreissena polymorpha TaxID=45954 RepID=A0A9D4M824_DREPO|nr:hypothetical protein DPMN_035836 [Dreissena polymorpha]